MRLDRNSNTFGFGKYALIKLRNLNENITPEIKKAIDVLTESNMIEYGRIGTENEFFVVKLKDINSPGALNGYADEAIKTDPELAEDVRLMAFRAGINSPFCKKPD